MQSSETPVAETTLFLSRLRDATSSLHLALEANPLLASLTSPSLSLHNYQVYLSLMESVMKYFEPSIQDRSAVLLNRWSPRKTSLLISDDLEKVKQITGKTIFVPAFKPYEESITDHSALGFLYVMEGSKLGGRVIFKQIKRSIGLDESTGARYLADHGADTLSSWKTFLELFSSHIVKYNGEEQAISGANLAFLSLTKFFDSNKPLYEF